ncbi:unnamed protein product [Closterium sp. NIES-54]
MQPSEKGMAYISRCRGLRDRLLQCGGSISEEVFVTVVITGLGPQWRSTRAILRAHGRISEANIRAEIHAAEQQDMDLHEERQKKKGSVQEFAFHTQRRNNNRQQEHQARRYVLLTGMECWPRPRLGNADDLVGSRQLQLTGLGVGWVVDQKGSIDQGVARRELWSTRALGVVQADRVTCSASSAEARERRRGRNGEGDFGPAAAIFTMVDPVANEGVEDTLEARLAVARKHHADGEYRTIPLLIVELGIRSQWATEHPSRPVSPRPVQNEGGVDDKVDGGAQARVQRSTAVAGSSRANVDGQHCSPLRSGGGLSATTHVMAGGIAPTYGYFKFSSDRITVAPLQGRRDLITWRESIEPQLEVAGLKSFADDTVPIPPVDNVELRRELRAAHLLTFMVISSDEDDTKGGRSRSTSHRLHRDAKPRKEKQTSKKTSSLQDVDNSSGKSRGDGEASCSMVGVVESTVSLAPEASEDFHAVAAVVQANPMAVLLDSGWSHHLMRTKAVFVDMAPSDDVKYVCGFNGALQPVKGRRTVALQGEAGKRVLIPDFLYVPGVQANLLSAGQLKESGVQLQGDGDEMLLVAATGEMLGRARNNGRVLCTDLCPCSTRSSSTKVVALRTIISTTKSTPDRLHARLAHVGVDMIKSSAKHDVATGLNIKPSTGAGPPCVSCVGGKLARHTFPEKGSDAEEALAVVHIDLCGPFRVAAKDGSLYFLLLKDRHTRFVWVIPVTKKSDVLREFQKWLVLVERQAKKSVLMLCSGRGGEFLGKEFTNFVDGKGIDDAAAHGRAAPLVAPCSTTSCLGAQLLGAVDETQLVEGSKQLVNDLTVNEEGERSAREESTDNNVVEVPITKPELRRTGRARRLPERLSFHACLSPAAFTTVYDEVDDDLLYDNAVEDEERPELDPNVHADPEHRWDIAMVTVKEAMASWKGEAVKAAMEEEIRSLIGMGTWELVERPRGVNIMKNQWVLTTKYRIDDTVEREKARLVVKGFTQVCGADYDETFSTVSSYVTLRIFLSIVAVLDLNLMQLDMKNAFLQSKLNRVLYMYQPDYFDDGTGRVCKLLKSLYGLKQSPLLWYTGLDGVLLGAGWKKSQVDEVLYFKASDNGVTCWVLIYVDDLLAASSSPAMLKELKELLEAAFELREISPVVKYLGLEIVRDRPGGRAPKTPVLVDAYAELTFDDEEAQECEEEEYRQKFGSLQFAATTTRPDIAFACSKLGSGLMVRGDQHWREVDRCLTYLTDTRDTALEFDGGLESLELIGYVDADNTGDKQNRTSTGGYVFVYGGAAVFWSSSRIKCTTLSSTESEYVAATDAGKEGR